jgi:D-alanine-D-alanine ligase-like ATP-grasp enzyme
VTGKARPQQLSRERRFTWTEIFSGAATQVGGRIAWSAEAGSAGLITLPGGRSIFFHKGVLGINTVAAARIAKDKGFTSEFLRSRGYSVPEEQTFFHDSYAKGALDSRGPEEAAAYAMEIGYPVFVKPIHLSQGRGVAKVHDEADLREAIERIRGLDTVYLVQRAYDGLDVRLILINGEMLFGFERVPLSVVGDGRSTIADLLLDKQRRFDAMGRDTCLCASDWRIAARLQRLGRTLNDIPLSGEAVQLHDISNLCVGGVAVDRTDMLRTTAEGLGRRIAGDMRLGFCAIDLILSDSAGSAGAPVVLEVNSAPGLDHYLYDGEPPLRHVQRLYATLLDAWMKTSPDWQGTGD